MVQPIGFGSAEIIQNLFPDFTTYLADSRFRQEVDNLLLQYTKAFLEGDMEKMQEIAQLLKDEYGITDPAAAAEALGFLTPQGIQDIIEDEYDGQPPRKTSGSSGSGGTDENAPDYSNMGVTDLLKAYVEALRNGDTEKAEEIAAELKDAGITNPLAAAEKEGLL